LQTRLLRVLSDGHFYRVGGHSAVKANVRVVAATHQNLEQQVKEGGFREDLFHRLNVIRLRLPALRERREDVPLLTRFFLQQSAKQLDVEPKRISDTALKALSAFDFPGNVRQLENICHWLTVMAPAQSIEVKDLPPEVLQAFGTAAGLAAPPLSAPLTPTAPEPTGLPTAAPPTAPDGRGVSAATATQGGSWEQRLQAEAQHMLEEGCDHVWDELTRRFETSLIQTALSCTRGRRIEAAQKLGIGRNTITRKIQELNLE
jgi:two-component system, NtrC family, nitrogen regulation response regulator GlnG